MFRFTSAQISAREDLRRFCVTEPRRTRDLFYAIMLLILLGLATCTVLLTGTSGATFSSDAPRSSEAAKHQPATAGYPTGSLAPRH